MSSDNTRSDINSGIHCDVKSCVYHSSDHYCTLDRVSIGTVNSTNCSDSSETECASFRPRD
jgi:hypothetical protein